MNRFHEAFHRLVRGEEDRWWSPLARVSLRTLSIPYGAAVRIRNHGFDRQWTMVHRSPLPVISVGNITVGGTGKTPMVELLAKRIREMRRRVVILSRGYGSLDGPNDEAMVLEENLPDVPHLQGADRARSARIALEEIEAEVLILDDGFQHRRLHRDLDIVLLDATDPFGGGRLLPAGFLREPLSSLRRADALVLTRADLASENDRRRLRELAMRHAPNAALAEVHFEPVSLVQEDGPALAAQWLKEKRVALVSGIGNPKGFEKTAQGLGALVMDHRVFPDHFAYRRQDIEDLARWARDLSPDAVVCTQKDLVKLRLAKLADAPLMAIKIEAKIDVGEADLMEALAKTLQVNYENRQA